MSTTTTTQPCLKDVVNAHTVFNVPELLQMVLAQLPIKDLLLVGRVCKQWKGAIDTSLNLQKALFMAPEPIVSRFKIIWKRYEGEITTGYRRDLQHIIETPANAPPSVEDKKLESLDDDLATFGSTHSTTETFNIAAVNPSLSTASMHYPFDLGCFGISGHIIERGAMGRNKSILCPTIGELEVDGSFDPSWRRMFLTQPPVRELDFSTESIHPNLIFWPAATRMNMKVRRANGITMGDLVDALREKPVFERMIRKAGEKNTQQTLGTGALKTEEHQIKPVNGVHVNFFNSPIRRCWIRLSHTIAANGRAEVDEFKAFAAFTQTVEESKERRLIRAARDGCILSHEEKALVNGMTNGTALVKEWKELQGATDV